MKKIGPTIAVLFSLLVIGSMLGSAGMVQMPQQLVAGENPATVDDQAIEITQPKIGYLYAIGGSIQLDILVKYGWAVVIEPQLCMAANTSGDVDYVEFSAYTKTGELKETVVDNEAPFEACFNVSIVGTHFGYNLTAVAYYQDAAVATDYVSPVGYLRGMVKPPE